MFIYTYIINQKFSKNFLWVLKFIVMLRVMVKNFKITAGRCLMGRVGRVGRVDGDQKCPSIFFILCGYIDYVYVYLYTK